MVTKHANAIQAKSMLAVLVILTFFRSGEAGQKVVFEPLRKPRVIVLTDITNEPDDEQSMVRFLLYSNEYDVEGLIATTSVWLRDKVRPENIRERIEAYDKVRENLSKHAQGYPIGQHLLSVTKAGPPEFGMAGVGPGKSSEGSRHIMEVVDKQDERPVWVSVWGGPNCLAQALWDVKNSRSRKELDAFVSKLRVYTISDQDNSGRWMRLTFPKLFYIVSPSEVGHHEYYKATWTGISGDRQYKNAPFHKFELVDNPWLERNIIKNHGPLGALYPRLKYIMEGDTPSFIGLISNGLGSRISPSYGGWGGRYVLCQTYAETRPIWTNARGSQDTVVADNGIEYTSDQATIWRWRQAYQHDFAARMDWCVAETFEAANHNPVAAFNNDRSKAVVRMNVKATETLRLGAVGSDDPDGDKLSYQWFVYREAGNYAGVIDIRNSKRQQASFIAPEVNQAREIHVILALKDDGEPNLYSYRRVVVTVEP
ncbi:MAG: nucleoside hydrolase-like domain-containing protein [Planctomycetota bacterium]